MGLAHITVLKNSFPESSNRIACGGKRMGWLKDVIRDRGGHWRVAGGAGKRMGMA